MTKKETSHLSEEKLERAVDALLEGQYLSKSGAARMKWYLVEGRKDITANMLFSLHQRFPSAKDIILAALDRKTSITVNGF